jgi:hypothetical protein
MIDRLRKFIAGAGNMQLAKDVTTDTGLSDPKAGVSHIDYSNPHEYVGDGEKCDKCDLPQENKIHKKNKQ